MAQARKRISRERQEDTPDEGKRIVMRRGRAPGFSNSGLTDTEGTPRDINAEVLAAAAPVTPLQPEIPAPAPSAAAQGLDPGMSGGGEDFSPQTRLAQVNNRHADYAREFRLNLVQRMLLRRLPLDQIADNLGVSVATVKRDKVEITSNLRAQAKSLDIDELVGGNSDFYDEVVAMAMRAASTGNNPLPMRLAALRTALAGRNDKHRFYQAAGVYDVLRFRRAPGAEGASDIQRMLSLTADLMEESKRDTRTSATPNPLGEFSGSDQSGNL